MPSGEGDVEQGSEHINIRSLTLNLGVWRPAVILDNRQFDTSLCGSELARVEDCLQGPGLACFRPRHVDAAPARTRGHAAARCPPGHSAGSSARRRLAGSTGRYSARRARSCGRGALSLIWRQEREKRTTKKNKRQKKRREPSKTLVQNAIVLLI